MITKLKAIILFFLMTNIVYGVGLTINSDPLDCDVYIRKLGDSNKVKIGKTPLITNFDEITTNYVEANHFVVEVMKDGYFPYELVISELIVNPTP